MGNMHKNLVKFSHVVFELWEQRDKQTDILITVLCTQTKLTYLLTYTPPGGAVISDRILLIL